MEFWRLVVRPTRRANLVAKLMRDLESGHFAAPKALDVLTQYRTEQLSYSLTGIPRVTLPEKPLIRAFLQKYPEARAEPVALDSFTPPLARQFAQRQLQLMQAGAAREQAFTQAEQELAGRLQALRSRLLGSAATALSEGAQAAVPGPAASGVRGMVELLQQEEQEALDAGLEALASSAQQQQQQLSANSR
ncbi:hypothetical protein CHLRE_12g530500v5 [Chlamydomonas reinhardtii]|uniref:Small ribosomal subunit protein mS23 n=1 Tax=Chlamydomonas reinhardtii TaxID=3055 RepID=A8IW03_CHLRE|nr:uncharacterized protein CHLRE_12g530500v5 [Chlamydomonas reinhardtii]PNW75531.1 hypothetical protein CHLRE_12g530500v5 [Chlamydomonas reinhardtii]7PKQ_v Chain v, mS23 [Chlamydomonas reinhardtii]|eukprot:XP_001692928.1 predicted protein [Chlamydomonas reinhardtii]